MMNINCRASDLMGSEVNYPKTFDQSFPQERSNAHLATLITRTVESVRSHIIEGDHVNTISSRTSYTKPVEVMPSTSRNGAFSGGNDFDCRTKLRASADNYKTKTTRKRLSPSGQRKLARFLLGKIEAKKQEEISERDRGTLLWARGIMQEFANRNIATKSKQSHEQQVAPDSKKLQSNSILTNLDKTSSDVTEQHLIKAIIDRSNSDGVISKNKWKLIEEKLWTVYKVILKENPGPPPSCRDAGWFYDRVKLIACADQRSAYLLKLAMVQLGEIWPGAILDVVAKEDIPSRPRCKALIPVSHTDTAEILDLIKIGNPNIPTQDWTIVNIGESVNETRQITITITEESLAILNKMGGSINYGFSSLVLNVCNKSNQPPPDEVDSAEHSSMPADEAVSDLEVVKNVIKCCKNELQSTDNDIIDLTIDSTSNVIDMDYATDSNTYR